jgi:TP901 family phage tail tape measure protein
MSMASNNELQFILKMRDEASATLKNHAGVVNSGAESYKKLSEHAHEAHEGLGHLVEKAKEAAEAVSAVFVARESFEKTIGAFAEVETHLVRLRQVAGLTKAALDEIDEGVASLASKTLRQTDEELLDVAASAAQLGAEGPEQIMQFTKAVSELANVTGQSTAQVSDAIEQIVSATGGGVEAAQRLGDQLEALGAKTRGGVQGLTQYAQQVSMVTQGFNLSQDQVVGLGQAFANMGARGMGSAMAFTQTLTIMQQAVDEGGTKLTALAQAVGMSDDQFRQLIQDNPTQAFLLFAKAVGGVSDAGGEVSTFLKEFGLDARATASALQMVGENADKFQQSLDDAKNAQDGILNEHSKEMADTIASAMHGLAIAAGNFGEALGEAAAPQAVAVFNGVAVAIRSLGEEFKGLPGFVQSAITLFVVGVPSFLAVQTAFKLVSGAVLTAGASFRGLAGPIGSMVKFFQMARVAEADLIVAVEATEAALANQAVVATATAEKVAMAAEAKAAAEAAAAGEIMGATIGAMAGEAAAVGLGARMVSVFKGGLGVSIGAMIGAALGKPIGEGIGSAINEMAPEFAHKFAVWRNTSTIGAGINWLGGKLGIEHTMDGLPQAEPQGEGEARPEAKPEAARSKASQKAADYRAKERLDTLAMLAAGDELIKKYAGQVEKATELKKAQEELNKLQAVPEAQRRADGSQSNANLAIIQHQIDLQKEALNPATEVLRNLDKQTEMAKALTSDETDRVAIAQQLLDIERQHGALSDKDRQDITAHMQALQAARHQAALTDLNRSLDQQLATQRAVTGKERDSLDIIQQIVEFERQHGKLTEQQRVDLATKIAQTKQLADFQGMTERLDPVGTARREYEEQSKKLEVMRRQKVITDEQYGRMKQNLDQQTLSSRDPVGARVKSMREELQVLHASVDQRGIEEQVMQEANALRASNVQVTDEMTAALRDYVTAMDEYHKAASGGVGGWINEVGTLRDNMMDLTHDFASGLSGAISGALAGDKDSFRNFARQLGRKMIDTGVNQLMAQAFKGMGFQNGEQAALNKASAAADRIESLAKGTLTTPQAVVNAGSVNINGKALSSAVDAVNAGSAPIAANPAILGGGKEGSAVDLAAGMLGKSETGDRTQVNDFLKKGGANVDAAQTAWCAAFVNSSLKQVGVDGTGKLNATAFLNWGQKIDASQVMKGDVLVDSRGHGANETGGHVGFATGNSRMAPDNTLQLQMLSGNTRDRVGTGWYNANQLAVRRATPGMGNVQQQMEAASKQMSQAVQPMAQHVRQAAATIQQAAPQMQVGTQQAGASMQQLATTTQQTGQSATEAGQQFQQAGQQIQQAGQQAASGSQAAGAGGASGTGSLAGLFGPLQRAVSSGMGAVKGLMPTLAQVLPPPFNLLGGLLGGLFHFADGGHIKGPGSGTSDSILAAVSNGEFIVNARSTKEWGPVLQAINDNKVKKFASGGRIGDNVVSFSQGERELTSGRGHGSSAEVANLTAQVSELTRAVGRGGAGNRVNNTAMNVTVNARDADSFRRSEGQLIADAHLKMNRLGGRNN